MGRKVKETVEYFPFFVKDGKTLFVLQRKYGLAGIGFFTQVLRMLGQTPGHYYTYVDEYDKDRFNQYCGLSESDVRAMLSDMSNTGKIDKELWERRDVIYSQAFVDELSEAYRKRTTDLPDIDFVKSETVELEKVISPAETRNPPESAGKRWNPRTEKRREEESREEESRVAPAAEADASTVSEIDTTSSLKPVTEKSTQTPVTGKPKHAQKDPIAAMWEHALTEMQPSSTWGNYGKERKHCKDLAQRTRDLLQQTPYESAEALVAAVLEEYDRMKRTARNDYWKNAAWTPSQVISRWSTIWDSLSKQHATEEALVF